MHLRNDIKKIFANIGNSKTFSVVESSSTNRLSTDRMWRNANNVRQGPRSFACFFSSLKINVAFLLHINSQPGQVIYKSYQVTENSWKLRWRHKSTKKWTRGLNSTLVAPTLATETIFAVKASPHPQQHKPHPSKLQQREQKLLPKGRNSKLNIMQSLVLLLLVRATDASRLRAARSLQAKGVTAVEVIDENVKSVFVQISEGDTLPFIGLPAQLSVKIIVAGSTTKKVKSELTEPSGKVRKKTDNKASFFYQSKKAVNKVFAFERTYSIFAQRQTAMVIQSVSHSKLPSTSWTPS